MMLYVKRGMILDVATPTGAAIQVATMNVSYAKGAPKIRIVGQHKPSPVPVPNFPVTRNHEAPWRRAILKRPWKRASPRL
jgi:hypothetical protein